MTQPERWFVTIRWFALSRLIRRIRRRLHRKRKLRPFSEVWDEFQRKHDFSDVDIDPDEVFRDVRSRDPGRDFIL
jgi:hypothetical protein